MTTFFITMFQHFHHRTGRQQRKPPRYAGRLRAKVVNPCPQIRVDRTSPLGSQNQRVVGFFWFEKTVENTMEMNSHAEVRCIFQDICRMEFDIPNKIETTPSLKSSKNHPKIIKNHPNITFFHVFPTFFQPAPLFFKAPQRRCFFYRSSCRVHGDDGMGFVVAAKATEEVVEKTASLKTGGFSKFCLYKHSPCSTCKLLKSWKKSWFCLFYKLY